MIHRKKNAPALQRRDVSTVSLVSSCFREFADVFFYPGVSGSVLLSIPWRCVLIKTLLFFGLFLRSLSTQLFFLVASLFLVLGVTVFCYGVFF